MDLNFFNYEDFSLNTRWDVTIQSYNNSYILFIDNVYKNPLKIYQYLKTAPIFSHKPTRQGSLNGKDFLDGQHVLHPHFYNDKGRQLLISKICKFYKLPLPKFPLYTFFNQFKLLQDYPGLDYYWNIHIDNALNVLTYLNPDENISPGTSIYEPALKNLEQDGSIGEHVHPWVHNKFFNEKLCLLSKFNSSVVFPGEWPHSQKIIDNRYKLKMRFTEITFI